VFIFSGDETLFFCVGCVRFGWRTASLWRPSLSPIRWK
jgi:hypothetical protein